MGTMKNELRYFLRCLITGVIVGLIGSKLVIPFLSYASITCLFAIPVVLGVVPLTGGLAFKQISNRRVLTGALLTVSLFFLTLFLLFFIDLIGFIILSVPYFLIGTISALIFRNLIPEHGNSYLKLLIVLLSAITMSWIEHGIKRPSKVYTITNEVVVTATAQTIWDNIVEVGAIESHEYHSGFFNRIGIPRPVKATVNKKEVGGQRVGNFEGGLKFLENITQYEAFKTVSFDIKIDPRSISPKVFDLQIFTGNYFSFIDATYQLTDLQNGQIRLSLSSSYRLTSTVNFYGKIWGNLILSDFQSRLLNVIKNRC